MSETVLVAIVAVAGTSLGAAISPLIGLVRDAMQSQGDAKSERLRAAAHFGEVLVKFARVAPSEFDSAYVRKMHTAAVEARFDLAKYIPKGAGQVDAFAEHAIGMTSVQDRKVDRLVIAEFCASALLAWARDDRPATKLHLFEVTSNGDLPIVII